MEHTGRSGNEVRRSSSKTQNQVEVNDETSTNRQGKQIDSIEHVPGNNPFIQWI